MGTAMKKVCPSCVEHQKQLTEWCRDIKREPAQLANILDTCTPSDLQSLKSIPEELWLHSMMQPSARIDTDLIREAIPAERLSEIPNLARVLETLELEEAATPPAVMVCSDYSSEEDEGSFSDSSICSGEDDCEAEQIDFDWEVVDAVANSDTGEEGGSYYVNLKSNGSSESQWDRPVEGIIGRATKCICCGGKILEADDGFVFGDWDLGETGLQSLPDSFAHQELHITGSLLLDHNELRTLPKGTYIFTTISCSQYPHVLRGCMSEVTSTYKGTSWLACRQVSPMCAEMCTMRGRFCEAKYTIAGSPRLL